MTVDRDYGSKYIDFQPAAKRCRLGLMPRKDLAKDVGVAADGAGFGAVVFRWRAETPDKVDALLAAAGAAGGHVALPAARISEGGYSGNFTDPDGFVWKVETGV